MKKVDELEQQKKFREAWVKVPEPSDFPEQAETLRKRRSALAAKFSPDLFEAPVTAETAETQEPANDFFPEEDGSMEVSYDADEEREDDEQF